MFSAFIHSLMPTRIWQEEPQSSGQTKTASMLQQEGPQTFLLDNNQKKAGQNKASISVGVSTINANTSVHSCRSDSGGAFQRAHGDVVNMNQFLGMIQTLQGIQKYYFCKANLCSFLKEQICSQQIMALSLLSKCKNLKWIVKKIRIGMLHITFPSDYKHLDHLDLGTEQF